MSTLGAIDNDAAIDAAILPHLPKQLIKALYAAAPGNELDEKFSSPASSAALVVNAFGLYLTRDRPIQVLPGLEDVEWPAMTAVLEGIVRFPWSGGRHPCLDVLIETPNALIGVESKRYEPFRNQEIGEFSGAYQRNVWGNEMERYQALRDSLSGETVEFSQLDAVQLVKHAFGLRTVVNTDPALKGKAAILYYVYAEPRSWPNGNSISESRLRMHRDEIAQFSELVTGDEVQFCAASYQCVLANWSESPHADVREHVAAILQHFDV